MPEEDQPEVADMISKGHFTMRIMYDQFANISKMGSMSQVRHPPWSAPAPPPGTCAACRVLLEAPSSTTAPEL